jgi:hypothetical protein
VLSNDQLDLALSKSPGERITKEYMASRITETKFISIPDTTVIICNITLDNGYSVRGESACVDPANYNVEIGQRISYDQAFSKLWPLFGFMLAENIHRNKMN